MKKKPARKKKLTTDQALDILVKALQEKKEPSLDVATEFNKIVEDLLKRLDDVNKRLEKLEGKSKNDEYLDLIKKIKKEEQEKEPVWPPEPPWKIGRKPRPWRPYPFPKPRRKIDFYPDPWNDRDQFDWETIFKCEVCNIKAGDSGGYVCNRTDCPNAVTFGDTLTTNQTRSSKFLDVLGQNETMVTKETCACGQNASCQCCK